MNGRLRREGFTAGRLHVATCHDVARPAPIPRFRNRQDMAVAELSQILDGAPGPVRHETVALARHLGPGNTRR